MSKLRHPHPQPLLATREERVGEGSDETRPHQRFPLWNQSPQYAFLRDARGGGCPSAAKESAMSLGMILIIIVIIYLLGGFSGRFGGYGYGMGHSGMGLGGVILVVLLVLFLLGKL
jgi:Protein of unknown function (DUF3309)